MQALCLVVDRWHIGYAGCYGNGWVGTPRLDRLAAESFVFDRAMVDSTSLDSLCRSYWLGQHAWSAGRELDGPSLADRLSAAGIATALVTDDPQIASHPLARSFAQRQLVERIAAEVPADELADTAFAWFFASAIDALESLPGSSCAWFHTIALAGPWDAPLDFRNHYVDESEGESPPPESADPPRIVLPLDPDPDELLGWRRVYAGQVAAFDACLGALLDAIDESTRLRDALLIVLGARGLPLGEHGRLGTWEGPLYSELVRVPWLIRRPDRTRSSGRSQAIVQPADLPATLLDWFGQSATPDPSVTAGRSLLPLIDDDRAAIRDRAYLISPAERALYTPAWFLRLEDPPNEGSATAREREPPALGAATGRKREPPTKELFVKPDDRWEMNEVSNRCPEVVEGLEAALAAWVHAAESGIELSPLDDVLIRGMA